MGTESSQPIDGLLGGMAARIIKERNLGPMLLKFLSGNESNADIADKQYVMVVIKMTVFFF